MTFIPAEERDGVAEARALLELAGSARDFKRAARRYDIAQEARAAAVRHARDAGLSLDEIAAVLGVTRAVVIRLERRVPATAGA